MTSVSSVVKGFSGVLTKHGVQSKRLNVSRFTLVGSIVKRFDDVPPRDPGVAVEICDGARDLEHPMVAAR